MIQLLRNNTFNISSLVLVISLNILFTTLPLLNLLSYESSAINAILFSLFSGIYWLAREYDESFSSHIKFFASLIILPFFILLISTIFCQNCPISDGIYFYIIIAVPSILTGLAIAQLSKFFSVRFRYLIFPILWLFVLLGFLPELYYNPQIYFYNPIFAYYPGVIYDQTIEITNNLLLYRLIVFVISMISIIIFSRKNKVNVKIKFIVLVGIFFLYFLFSLLKPILNFSTNFERIKSEISSEVRTEHFKIIFPSTLTNEQIEILKYDHEFYYKIISELLNTELESKIISIIFESSTQKKELFGSANADVAKPWLNQIYLNYSNYDNSLKHEISHIFSAKFAEGLFNLPSNFNPGMIEGFAMAIENNYDDFDIDYLAALAFNNDYKVSLSNLFTDFSFFSNATSLSYIYAGSFIKYLASKFGWETVKKIYSGKEFDDTYDIELLYLEEDYYKYLSSIAVEDNIHISNYYFGRKPLIKKFCARATAKELRNAQKYYKQKKYEEAALTFSKIYSYSDSYSALVGFVQTQRELEKLNEGIAFLENELPKFEGTAYYYYLEFLSADFYTLNNDSAKASEYYQKIIEQNPHKNYLRSAKNKNKLLLKGDSILIKFMGDRNFKTNLLLEQAIKEPTDYSLQLISALDDMDSSQYSEIISSIIKISEEKDFSHETYFELSKLAYKYLDYKTALKTADFAYSKTAFKSEKIIKEHIDKIKWIMSIIKSN